jgi:hypothetical protein
MDHNQPNNVDLVDAREQDTIAYEPPRVQMVGRALDVIHGGCALESEDMLNTKLICTI